MIKIQTAKNGILIVVTDEHGTDSLVVSDTDLNELLSELPRAIHNFEMNKYKK